MRTEQIYYLKHVLGIDSLIAEQGMAVDSVATGAVAGAVVARSVVADRQVCIYSPFDFSTDEKAIVDKMLAAIDITSAIFISQSKADQKDLSALLLEKSVNYGISFGLSTSKSADVKWLELESISSFLNTKNAAQLNALKKSTWAQLKKFKSEII